MDELNGAQIPFDIQLYGFGFAMFAITLFFAIISKRIKRKEQQQEGNKMNETKKYLEKLGKELQKQKQKMDKARDKYKLEEKHLLTLMKDAERAYEYIESNKNKIHGTNENIFASH